MTPALWMRMQAVFARIEDTAEIRKVKTEIAKARAEIVRQLPRLQRYAREVRRECLWVMSLLPPTGRPESMADMEARLMRQLWQQYGHLGHTEFCRQFKISTPTLYRKLGSIRTGFDIATNRRLRYNFPKLTPEGSLTAAYGSRAIAPARDSAAASKHDLPLQELGEKNNSCREE
jgi:hypothetical protein